MPRTATLALLLLASAASAAGTRFKTSGDQAMKAFRLTTENVRKASAATRRLSAEVAKNPAIGLSAEKRGQQADALDAKAKALESDPRIASVLRAESITAREFIMVHMAAIQAGMVVAMKAQGVQLDAGKIGEAMNPANVEFPETHRKEMDELGRSQQELQKGSKEANRGKKDSSEEMEQGERLPGVTSPVANPSAPASLHTTGQGSPG